MLDVRRAQGSTDLVAASLFAGAGGSSLGYRLAGFRLAYSNEFERLAADTYALNADDTTVLDRRDVRDVKGEDVVQHAGGTVDVLDGSPPCQGFSIAGSRDLEGENCLLYREFVRLVGDVKPRAFCAENVLGLVQGESRTRHFLPILAGLRGHRYRVATRVLDASRLGVAQARHRVVIIGFRDDTRIDPATAFPRRSRRVTAIRDALPGCVRITREPQTRKAAQVNWGEAQTWPAHRPAPTLTASGLADTSLNRLQFEALDGHQRSLTTDDLKALCGFPADFEVPEGTSLNQAWRLFGNAVPPPMARAWGDALRDALAPQRPRPRRGGAGAEE